MNPSVIGRSVSRLDIRTKVKGQRKYPQDFYREGMLHAAVVWSAYPHARIVSIDTNEAEAYQGVITVLTHKDVPVNEYGIITMDQQVLCEDKVRWLGDRLAVVVAETETIAREAAKLVSVEYEPLPVMDDPRESMKLGAVLVHEKRDSNVLGYMPIRRGDVEAGFAEADVTVEGYYFAPHVEHAYLQPEAGLGYIDDEGRVTVVCASQWAYDDVHQMAHALDLPEDRVREIIPAIGGAFGGREDISLQILVALAAHVTRRPVKMIWTREESIRGHGKRHPFYLRYKHGAKRGGTLVAMEAEVIADAGAYASTSAVVLANATSFAAGPYVIPNVHIDAYTVYTNNAVAMAMRGFGATQMPLGYESQMDRLAEALSMDPVELRLKNLYEEGSIAITGNPVTNGIGAKEPLIQVALAAGWKEEKGHWRAPAIGPPCQPHLRRGLGVACGYKNVGYSMGFDDKSEAIIELRLREDGSIASALIRTGASEVGQGVSTVLAQIAAETLGIPFERVRMALVDTARVPDAGSSSASRHTYMSGKAVLLACQDALRARDAVLREESGQMRVEGRALFHGRTMRATTPLDPETGQCEPHIAYTFASQIALVEVDTETGGVEIIKMWASTNCGKAINPAMVFGQVAGGIHMGVGYALTEHFIQQEGWIKTRTLGEYYIPTVLDMPRELVNIDVEVPDPTGPYGATGIGETTTLPTAPAILNAIHDATGVWITRLPAEPETVWRALHGIQTVT